MSSHPHSNLSQNSCSLNYTKYLLLVTGWKKIKAYSFQKTASMPQIFKIPYRALLVYPIINTSVSMNVAYCFLSLPRSFSTIILETYIINASLDKQSLLFTYNSLDSYSSRCIKGKFFLVYMKKEIDFNSNCLYTVNKNN